MRLLARLNDALWTIALGAFLGLAAGLVLAVIFAFNVAADFNVRPGIDPYQDPVFAQHWNDFVGGAVGQMLFQIGGSVALGLLGLALIAFALQLTLFRKHLRVRAGHKRQWARACLFCVTIVGMGMASYIVIQMDRLWPDLYNPDTTLQAREDSRAEFDHFHKQSERVVSVAWLAGVLALGISPWCLGDTKEEA